MPRLDIVNSLLFPTPRSSYDPEHFPEELIWVPRSLDPENAPPEECIPCLLLTSPAARFCALYMHSNAEDLGRCYTFCAALRTQFQIHVLAVEYPGYGICPGQATEDSVTANSLVALNFIRKVLKWNLDEIILLGRSVGCGPALALAAKYRVYGLILVCPFLSVRELCREFLGTFAEWLAERFPNQTRMARVTSPLLIVHGKRDTMVPYAHGRALYDACKTRKRFVAPEEMTHNSNLYSNPSFFVLPMLQFFCLPDYCFEELKVPEWVFDKRRCHLYQEGVQVPLGMVGADTSCQRIFMPSPPTIPHAPSPKVQGEMQVVSMRLPDSPDSMSPRTSRPVLPGDDPQQQLEVEKSIRLKASRTRSSSPRASIGALAALDPRSRGASAPPERDGKSGHSVCRSARAVAEMALDRFMQMQGRESDSEDPADMLIPPEEQLAGWPMVMMHKLSPMASGDDEDLPSPPPDMGFLKVPRSNGGGPGIIYGPIEDVDAGASTDIAGMASVKYLAGCAQAMGVFGGDRDGELWAKPMVEFAGRPARPLSRPPSPAAASSKVSPAGSSTPSQPGGVGVEKPNRVIKI